MSDRALIHFHDGTTLGPCIYLHRGGTGVADLLRDTAARMEGRGCDVSYTTARCIGLAHERIPGNCSLGVWSSEENLDRALVLMSDDYSHGDSGVFLVDCRDWSVTHFGGYGFGHARARDSERRTFKREEWDRAGSSR